MPATEQTLETELARLAGQGDLCSAIKALHLLPSTESHFRVEATTGWYRGGAETYLYRFRVTTESGVSTECVLKACVALTFGRPIKAVFESWLDRRRLLEHAGASTPTVYAASDCIILEEYIQHSFGEGLARSLDCPLPLLRRLAKYAGTLAQLGFAPIEPFCDLRTRGADAVPVDFGEDLGNACAVANNRDLLPRMFEFIESLNIFLGERDKADLVQCFDWLGKQ